jgi:hypothetical protein
MASRRKTGQKPLVRQPLKMDKLPTELLDRVMKERAAGRTWMEIEEMSPRFEEWEKTPETIRAEFPGLKLPHSTLLRWHDLRVDQVKKEMMAQAEKAREIAGLFAGREFKDLPEAVRNALGDKIFALMQSADEKAQGKTLKGLLDLGWLLAQQRKLELQERKQQTDERELELKIEAVRAKVAALKKDVEGSGGKKKQLSPEELKQRVDEIYGLSAA